mmetsp:Transcript_35684/g.39726  ORF Transcript_35684/g.39726 Transcript_35684/m.39726 type:complete len:234 (-) Transcript_35684:211-912(-)
MFVGVLRNISLDRPTTTWFFDLKVNPTVNLRHLVSKDHSHQSTVWALQTINKASRTPPNLLHLYLSMGPMAICLRFINNTFLHFHHSTGRICHIMAVHHSMAPICFIHRHIICLHHRLLNGTGVILRHILFIQLSCFPAVPLRFINNTSSHLHHSMGPMAICIITKVLAIKFPRLCTFISHPAKKIAMTWSLDAVKSLCFFFTYPAKKIVKTWSVASCTEDHKDMVAIRDQNR